MVTQREKEPSCEKILKYIDSEMLRELSLWISLEIYIWFCKGVTVLVDRWERDFSHFTIFFILDVFTM